jgi:hypothetical protein
MYLRQAESKEGYSLGMKCAHTRPFVDIRLFYLH